MRTRTLISAVAAAAIAIAAGTSVHAEPAEAATGTEAVDSVVLPTGDRVTILPNGVAAIEPAEGREDVGFLTPTAPGADDRIVVPLDMAESILAGEEDPRRYNVTRLLEAGQHDAAAAEPSTLDERRYDGLVPALPSEAAPAASAAQTVTVTFRDMSGQAPDGGRVVWMSESGDAVGVIPINENGQGTAELEPGRYGFQTEFWNVATGTERGEFVGGFVPATVGDEPVELVVGADDALPVGVEVERPEAKPRSSVFALGLDAGEQSLLIGTHLSSGYDAFMLPWKGVPEWEQSFFYQSLLTDSDLSTVYNLAFFDRHALPDDPSFTVADEELAELDVTYQSQGVDGLPGRACDYADVVGEQLSLGTCPVVDTVVPSKRTVLYTADPELEWDRTLKAGKTDPDGGFTSGFTVWGGESLEPGQQTRTMAHGALAAIPPNAYLSEEDGALILDIADFPAGGLNGETLGLYGFRGEVYLGQGGEEIARAEDVDFYRDRVSFELPADSGRYTLMTSGKHESDTVLFGSEATAVWNFDAAATGEAFHDLSLPVAALRTDGVEGGYAERGGSLDVSLELVVNGGADTDAVDLAFEVSYDDGRTWDEVALEHGDGDTATGTLQLPETGDYASVRMTALDDAGTEVTHTTLRSFGLR